MIAGALGRRFTCSRCAHVSGECFVQAHARETQPAFLEGTSSRWGSSVAFGDRVRYTVSIARLLTRA